LRKEDAVVSSRGSKSFVGNLLNFRMDATGGLGDFDELDALDVMVVVGVVSGDGLLLFGMEFGVIFGVLEGRLEDAARNTCKMESAIIANPNRANKLYSS